MERQSWFVVFSKMRPYMAMVLLQFGYAGMFIISMLCLKRGLSHYVLVVYRHLVATIVMAPFALVLERKVRPKLTLPIFLKITVLGLLEPVIDQNLYYVGMQYTSATFTSAMFNILPAITFVMALIFRLEIVNIKKVQSQAKVVGTLVTVGGAMIMTLYKGPILEMVWSRGRSHHGTSNVAADTNWIKGTIMLLASCSGWSGFFILQSFTLEAYPVELSLTTLICLMGMVQSAAVALVMERNPSAWLIGWDMRLLAPAYTGIVCSGLAYYVQGVVMKERGPVFVTAFNPLCMVIVAILGSLVLGDVIHLGSVIGAIIIVLGLYSVVWGKSKDPVTPLSLNEKMGAGPKLPMATSDVVKMKSGDDSVSSDILMPEISIEKPLQDK
ncbi:WAT1-related protein At1g44800-like [Tasmannia lanceolata]|uniref:WAT1-related protein At1g44800-like n=1 Tax=Tasmannia lanceolata TaxID=3420 RepID=UPI00406308DF